MVAVGATFRVIFILLHGHFPVTILLLMGLSPLTLQMLSTHICEATPTKWQQLLCYIKSYSPLIELSLQCDHPTTNGVIPTGTTDVINTYPGSHKYIMAAVSVLRL